MDFKEIVRMGLQEYMDELRKALNGLTPAERRFMPAPESHHIDFTVWHMARVEDGWVHRFAMRAPQVWERDGWPKRLGLPERDSGFGYNAQQVKDLPQYDFDGIMAYYDAVRQDTLKYLDSLTEKDLDRYPDPERRPGYSIGRMFSHILIEEAQHVGQVAYIRGIQRGLGK